MPQTGQEYVCNGALCRCDKGTLPSQLTVTSNQTVSLQGKLLATHLDKVFRPFGTCLMKNNTPCVPALLLWQDVHQKVGVGPAKGQPLLEKSTIKCALGGTVSVLLTLQIKVPAPPLPSQVAGLRNASAGLCPLLLNQRKS